MILPIILIFLMVLFTFCCIVSMMKNGHDLHAMAFLSLLIYTVFAQLGYVYFPELSMVLNAYYGVELFYHYWLFLFSSFVLTYIMYVYVFRVYMSNTYFSLHSMDGNVRTKIFLLIYLLLFTLLTVYYFFKRDGIQYGDGNALGSLWFSLFLNLFSCLTIIVYALIRLKYSFYSYGIIKLIFVLSLLFILDVAFRAGARSTILYFFIGIITYEFRPFIGALKRNKKKIIYFIVIIFLLIKVLNGVLYLRVSTNDISVSNAFTAKDSNNNDSEWYLKLIFQDYYAPSHTLFIAMGEEMIDFYDSVKSNMCNSMFGFDYPLITQRIVSKVTNFDYADRGVGYAFYIFSEGYYTFGWFGIFYNALIWNLGMLFFVRLTQTNNQEFNNVLVAVFASFVITLMRNQSSYFIKFAWMYFIPSFVLLLFALNYNVKFIINTEKE